MKKTEYLRQRIQELERNIEFKENQILLSKALLVHMTHILQDLEGQLYLEVEDGG